MVEHILLERRDIDAKRTLKLVAVPIIVLMVIAVSIGAVFAARGGDRSDDSSKNQELIQIALPTSSPTFVGDYHCPDGYVGRVPTKGCLGYVQCNGSGSIEGQSVLPCPPKTLFDVKLDTCAWEESVDCPTIVAEGATDTTTVASSGGMTSPSSRPTVSTIVETNTEQVGPTNTYNHKLAFRGVLTLGDVSTFERNMENYINIFFSPSRGDVLGTELNDLAADDPVLNSLLNVNVDLTIKEFEWSGSTRRLREMQQETNAELVMIYDQTTQYSTTDSSIKVGTVVRHPYEEEYESFLINYLKTTDDVFATLTSIDFLEPGQNSSGQTTAPVATPSVSPSIRSISTSAPSIVIETDSPTNSMAIATVAAIATTAPSAPISTPSPTQMAFVAFPEYATIQGFLWIDENKNGLYETTEPPAAGTFANLRHCDNRWVQTTSSNGNGQYQFLGVEEGEYYVEFFRPSENCESSVIGFIPLSFLSDANDNLFYSPR
jgi:hypothetical protein